MATIHDLLIKIKSMQDMQSRLETSLQNAARPSVNAVSEASNRIAEYVKQINVLTSQRKLQESSLIAHLSKPAFDASISIKALLDQQLVPHAYESSINKFASHLKDQTDQIQHLTAAAASSNLALTKLYQQSILSEEAIKRVSSLNFAYNLYPNIRQQKHLLKSHEKFSSSYLTFVESVARPDVLSVGISQNLVRRAVLEFFNHSVLVARSSGVEVDQDVDAAIADIRDGQSQIEDESLSRMLAGFGPGFLTMLEGSRASIDNQQPDYERHACTSLRELFTNIIHRLAPDESIKTWSKDSNHFYFNKDNVKCITRRARIEYIVRDHPDKFKQFAVKDAKVVLEFFDRLSAVTHGTVYESDHATLVEMCRRMESFIFMLLSCTDDL
ncbi:hypothetical protein [Singulisphaera sp. PoT]|uniref:pPIWI-associating nuclease domain-containing protein n=1 Tax=Singulisphaera sp. PoT TaxID=3411797 RepID=UPI003BF5F5C1